MTMKANATLSGYIQRERINIGSKSEHDAIVLKTDDGLTVSLRLAGANPFEGAPFYPFVGRYATATGLLANSALILKDMGDLKVAPGRTCGTPPPRP